MPTPKAGYYLADERVPGVTTIIGRFKDASALIWWSWDLGMQGKDYRKVRDEAGATGTLVHDLIEAECQGLPYESDDAKAMQAYGNYKQWLSMSGYTIIPLERPLVSPTYRYGGTPDALMLDRDGKHYLIDWKTSNAVYPDNIIQGAAYAQLLLEVEGIAIHGLHVCRFTKESLDFHHHFFGDLKDGWTAFVLMRELYEIDKRLKKRC